MAQASGISAAFAGMLLLGACGPTYYVVPPETPRKCRAFAESVDRTLDGAPAVCRSRHGAIRVPPPLLEIPLP